MYRVTVSCSLAYKEPAFENVLPLSVPNGQPCDIANGLVFKLIRDIQARIHKWLHFSVYLADHQYSPVCAFALSSAVSFSNSPAPTQQLCKLNLSHRNEVKLIATCV